MHKKVTEGVFKMVWKDGPWVQKRFESDGTLSESVQKETRKKIKQLSKKKNEGST